MAESSSSTSGYITRSRQHVHVHDVPERITIRDAVRAIQKSLQQDEDKITAAIESGRSYYLGKKVHSADCPTLKGVLSPTASWFWVTETDDPKMIEANYAEVIDGMGSGGWYLPGRLVTREEAAQTALKRCRTCAPDVNPRVAGQRPKKVAGLGASDLGRLLDGHPIESIIYEPGVVIVRTSETSHRFDPAATVLLEPAPSGATEDASEAGQHQQPTDSDRR
ncbi:hypothetical protein IU470_30245 [Nocardia abscessus]|uniref:Uncharacterized protein n=1 Tax=Nocardia abscessus TaxID=120957 RepID=A0ABS0CGB0_9NOCA|nr:hypothetical protein [Nocardia abscessus]MBF6229359.1 hypothetical protein [Nocardia abscessus]